MADEVDVVFLGEGLEVAVASVAVVGYTTIFGGRSGQGYSY